VGGEVAGFDSAGAAMMVTLGLLFVVAVAFVAGFATGYVITRNVHGLDEDRT
jgi:hypothetical protein